MIVCDYCGTEITDNPFHLAVRDPMSPMMSANLLDTDLHPECVTPWTANAKTAKGPRPPKPPKSPPPTTPSEVTPPL